MAIAKELAKLWFENLGKIQGRVQGLNSLTKDKLKPFSNQKPNDLLISDLLKQNLSQFCQQRLSLNVPSAAYEENTFREFLNFIGFSIEEAILTLFYRVAIKRDPKLLDLTRKEVGNMTIQKVYGQDPLSSNAGKQELHKLLVRNIQEDFYSEDSLFLDESALELRGVIDKILNE
jgi:hypothetical protein